MTITKVILPCTTGDEVRYLAQEQSPFTFVSAVASTHMGAIIACLKQFNKQAHYDPRY